MLGFFAFVYTDALLAAIKTAADGIQSCGKAFGEADQSESISEESVSKPNSFTFCSMCSE